MKYLLSASFLLFVCLNIVDSIIDPDIWWHITIGNWIWAHAELPSLEVWNRYALGKPWRAYSWLSELLFYGVDSNFGVRGLLLLKWTLVFFLLVSCAVVYLRMSGKGLLALLLAAMAVCASSQGLSLRPQLLVFCIYPWILWLGYCARSEQGLSKFHILLLLLLFAFWSNNHLTAVIALASFGSMLDWGKDPRRAVVYTSVAIFGTLLTPYLGGEWITLFLKSDHPLKFREIAEFQPANLLQYGPAVFLLLIGVFLASLHFELRRLPPMGLFFGLLLSLGALSVVKFLPFAAIYVAFLVAWNLSGDLQRFSNLGEAYDRLRSLILRLPSDGLAFLLLAAAIVSALPVWRAPLRIEYLPKAAVEYLHQQKLPEPYLAEFGMGGYLMYATKNSDGTIDKPVAIDGRTNVLPTELWDMYKDAMSGAPRWKHLIEAVEPRTILWRSERPLVSLLTLSGEWCEVFKPKPPNAQVSVFVRIDNDSNDQLCLDKDHLGDGETSSKS